MTYHLFDLPPLPVDIIEQCEETVKNTEHFFSVIPNDYENFKFGVGFGEPSNWVDDGFNYANKKQAYEYVHSINIKPASIFLYKPPESVIKWVKENIQDTIANKYLLHNDSIELVKIENGEMFFPHTDPITSYSYNLNYVIWDGGPDVVTKFFEPNQEHINKPILCTVPYRFDTIHEVDSVRIEKDKWAMLSRSQLHSVCNLTKPRLLLQFGLNKNEL
jgi:hypothetical protein